MDGTGKAKAEAVLGVAPGVSRRALRRRYLALVRRWHPDHFAFDPEAQRGATERLREIIDAYELLDGDWEQGPALVRTSATVASTEVTAFGSTVAAGGRLSQEEIDEIVGAIGRFGVLGGFFDFLARSWPLWVAWAISVTPYSAGPPPGIRLGIVVTLLFVGIWFLFRPASGAGTATAVRADRSWNRILSGALAAAWTGLLVLAYGGSGIFLAARELVLPLACIWFPEEMASAKGFGVAGSSPPGMVLVLGWIVLIAVSMAGPLIFVLIW